MSSAPITIDKIPGEEVTEGMLGLAANLFSESYGVWGKLAEEKMGPFAKPGRRVRMNADRLRLQSLPEGGRNVFVRAMAGEELAGHLFATRWVYQERQVCWVTQLCVKPKFRRNRLATNLLLKLREDEADRGFGILSSHPAAILAALRAFARGIEEVDLSMAKEHAKALMASSPVGYVRDAKLGGSLFVKGGQGDAVCCVDTGFYVDHEEPLAALAELKVRGSPWPFGELPEGHECLVLVNSG